MSKHELRTKQTRAALLRAAETVFVRDGYEKADLLEIAELAGRTKGSIYGQFKSKEEIFLALVEAHALKRRSTMHALLSGSHSLEGNLQALRRFYIDMAADDVFGLLLLEFRLYTIRHPDVRERLAELYKSIVPTNEEAAYTAMLGKAKGRHALKRAQAMYTAFAMLYALQVEMKFDPALFDAAVVKGIAGRIFDALFEPSTTTLAKDSEG